MANPKEKPLGERLKKFISQYTDSKANAVNLFMYGILFIFVLLLIGVIILSLKFSDYTDLLNFEQPTTGVEQSIETTK